MNISELLRAFGPEGWREQAASHLFPSDESLRWFVRRHRADLIDAGAIVQVAGRVLVHPPTMCETIPALFKRDLIEHRRGRHSDQVRGNQSLSRSTSPPTDDAPV